MKIYRKEVICKEVAVEIMFKIKINFRQRDSQITNSLLSKKRKD
jgi:hypothetical protein